MSTPNVDDWWGTWAPYWEHIEDRHFGLEATAKVLPHIDSPVLVVGAGHGLIVNHLKERGLAAYGVDTNVHMLEMARRRRDIRLVRAHALRLPFADQCFRTVIISSGVVDFGADDATIQRILSEALRVTMARGNLIISFYQLVPRIERLYRRMGVLAGGNYYMKRIFELGETARHDPVACVPKIMGWTGAKYWATLLFWLRMGVARPKVFRDEQRKMEKVFRLAAEQNVDYHTLTRAVPEVIPYRNLDDILRVLDANGLRGAQIFRSPDCVIARYGKPVGFEKNQPAPPAAAPGGDGAWHIRTENVCKRYRGARSDAVHALSLSVARGSVFGILGPNGAGKTTLLSLLSGLLAPDRGEIRFAGDLSSSKMRKRMGLVPQNLALYPKLTARENLAFFGHLYGMRGRAIEERGAALLETMGLSERADDRVETYSTGMMRRLNLIAGLIHDPEVLFLDEPTVGIDPQSRNRIFDMVLGLKHRGMTILYTTHYMEEASRLCDHLVIMDRGAVLLAGSPDEIVRTTGLYRLDFDVEQLPAPFLEELRTLAPVLAVHQTDHVLAVATHDNRGAVAIIDHIKPLADKHGARLSLRSVTEPSLESVFLDLTGRSMRDEIEAP